MKAKILLGSLAAIALTSAATHAYADPAVGSLFFTDFNGNVYNDTYSYDGSSTLTFSATNHLASTSGSDGILFAPDGNLLVAGQGVNNGQITEVTTGGTIVAGTPVPAGTGSYHLALASNAPNSILYNMWNGSGGGGSTAISALTLAGGSIVGTSGTPYAVSCASGTCSTDVRGVIFDPHNNTWYYGTAGDTTTGDFGTVLFNDVAHTATLTPIISGSAHAHGLSFDPFTNDIFFNQGTEIDQFDPSGGTVIGSIISAGSRFDQAAEDGKGHLFVASNNTDLLFADYDATGNISSATFKKDVGGFQTNLDDIAPLSGSGSVPTPEPATLTLLGVSLLGLGVARRRRR